MLERTFLLFDVLADDRQRCSAADAEKYEGDHKCPCMTERLIRPVNSWRIRRAETHLRLLTSFETANLGG